MACDPCITPTQDYSKGVTFCGLLLHSLGVTRASDSPVSLRLYAFVL